MITSRRNFLVGAGTAAATIPLAGCPAFLVSLEADIMNYVPVGLQAFSSIVSILEDDGVINPIVGTSINTIITAVKAGFSDLQLAIENYENAPAANKQTLLGKIATMISVVQGLLQEFWANLNIPDAHLGSVIDGLLGIILSVLAGFASQLPAVAARVSVKGGKTLAVTPQVMSKKTFKKKFNAELKSAGKAQYAIY
jgi:hypothetical protein